MAPEPSTPQLTDKMPRAVQIARDALEKLGITDIDATAIKQLPASARNSLRHNAMNAVSSAVKSNYSKLNTDEDRRAWLATYLIDPSCATSVGINKTEAVNDSLRKEKGEWLHYWEIGAPRRLNNEELAASMCEAGDFGEGQPSEFASLRAKGHRQYDYTKTTHNDTVGKRESRGVETRAELSEEQATEVRDSISSCSNPVPNKMARAEPPATTPRKQAAKKRRKDAVAGRASQMRKLKSLVDRASTDLKTLASQIPSLAAKNYPQAMLDWCLTQINPLQAEIDVAIAAYTKVVTVDRGSDADVKDLEYDVEQCTKAHATLETKYGEWKKGSAVDVRNLLA